MSTKFEQLLDYLVNEDHEKANELFHEIVVEKSREIYENLIAEEEDEDMDEARDEDEDMDESKEEDGEELEEAQDEEADESMDLEDSYEMEDETGDAADDFGGDISDDGDNFDAPADDAHGHEGQEDSAILDIKNAIQELEAAFAELEQAQGGEEAEMGMDADADLGMDGEEDGEDESMGFMEGRRITREYVEKVGHDYGKAQKADGDLAGAGTGEQLSKPVAGKSPVSSGKGKPTTGANASNILGDQKTAEGHNTGTTPNKVNKGITPEKSEQFTGKEWETNSQAGGKAGVKNLKKVGAGYPGNNKTPGPVGSGSGDKAGQTSIDPATKRQFLPQHTK